MAEPRISARKRVWRQLYKHWRKASPAADCRTATRSSDWERIQARHSQVNDLFEVTLRDTPAGLRLVWKMKEDRKIWRDLREGAYLLHTNLQAGSG